MSHLDTFFGRRLREGAIGLLFVAVAVCGVVWLPHADSVSATGGAAEINETSRVPPPIESGNLLLFPVVRANSKSPNTPPFVTLDEGLKNGTVEVTEAGKVGGLVRNRDNGPAIIARGDQVNTL